MPQARGGNKLSDALKIHNIVMNESVFAGANWGEGAGATQLTTRGFYGGESRLYIDGKKYNTSNNDQALEDGSMFISRSVLGSGTSVEGGDIHSQVEIRNYGATDACGQPVRTLESIQRTDSLWLHNTAIWLTGATDASSVNLTNKYTMSRIGDAMGGRDHTTVLHGCDKVAEDLRTSESLGALMDDIRHRLQNK